MRWAGVDPWARLRPSDWRSLAARAMLAVTCAAGALAADGAGKAIVIDNSRFESNGKCEPQCAHGIYIGEIQALTVRNSVFRGQKVGHHIKSRALETTVVDSRIEDGVDGTASYLIEIPW